MKNLKFEDLPMAIELILEKIQTIEKDVNMIKKGQQQSGIYSEEKIKEDIAITLPKLLETIILSSQPK